MKKRFLAAVLSALMVVSAAAAFAACGGDGDKTYTVTYAKSELGEIGPLPKDTNEYKAGDKVTLKSAGFLSFDGYSFAGWLFDGEVYKDSDEFTMPKQNVEFTAFWKQNGYTVSYANSRTEGTPIVLGTVFQAGDKVTLMEKPETFTDENGREFVGWYTVENEGQIVPHQVGEEYTMPAYDVTFYANWKATSIKATFYLERNSDAKDSYATKTYEIDATAIELPAAPTKKGYKFMGWERVDGTAFNEQSKFNEQEKQSGVIALFAKWEEAPASEQS